MSTIIATTLSNGTVSVPTATVVNGSAKAWVNFNGTGTIAARDSFNVASLTDNGTGDYTTNFTAALPDTNYVAQGLAGFATGIGPMYVQIPGQSTNFTQTTTAFRFGTASAHCTGIAASYRDTPDVFISFFR